MSTEKGYSNSKKYGRPEHKTVHNTGGDSFGAPVIIKSIKALYPQAPIEAVTLSTDNTRIRITITGHGASKGDRASFVSGNLAPYDIEVLQVIDANNFTIYNVNNDLPSIGDMIVIGRYASGTFGGESLTTFIKDGANQNVTEDSSDPSNNSPMPSGMMIKKEGVYRPVSDSATPSEVVSVPVKIMAVGGTNINITSGDINIQSSDMGANFDSFRLGNGSGNYADINANKEILSHDAEAKAELQSANTALLAIQASTGASATEATLATVAKEVTLGAVKTAVESIALKDFATKAEQLNQTNLLTQVVADTQNISSTINEDGNPADTKGILIGGKDSSGNFQQAAVNAAGELSVTFGSAGFATESTLSALNNKVANGYGAAAGATRSASQIGNASGQADFNSGADSAQTLRVSANIKRNGNELSYNSGAADANTQRVSVATGSDIKTAVDAVGAKLPSTIGQKAAAASLSVVIASGTIVPISQSPSSGTISSIQATVGLTAVRATVSGSAPSAARKKLMVKPSKNNTGSIYLGASGVTTTNGLEIIGPDRLEFTFDASDYYLISDTAAQVVEIVEVV